MRNKININGVNFEFPKFANRDKFLLLNNIFKKLNNTQKSLELSTCSSRKDKRINRELNEICDLYDDNHVNKIMNYITNDDIIIILDTEFQTFKVDNKKRDYVRELGLLIFIKHSTYDKNLKPNINIKWSYLGNIFVNFELLYDKFNLENMSCITSDFASISPVNKLEIHKVFHQIPVIKNEFEIFDEFNLIVQNFNNNKISDFNKFEDSVDDIKKNMKKYKSLKFNSCSNITDNIKYLKKIVDIYENDYNVRRRSFTSEYTEKEFLSDLNKLFNFDITVVIKGDGDIVSLKNSNSLYNNNHFGIRHTVDIARQNSYFHSIDLGSAKLEHTYNFLRYGLNPNNKLIKKPFYTYQLNNNSPNYKIINQVSNYLNITFKNKFKKNTLKFHNPIDDCIATFFILMMLNTNLHIGVISNMLNDKNNEDDNSESINNKYFNYNFNIIEKINESINFNGIGEFFNDMFTDSDSSELIFDFK